MTTPDRLDDLILSIKVDATLSAAAHNELSGCVSTHPWCAGKTFELRKMAVLWATAGRDVNMVLRDRVENLKA